jgi:Glycosyl hydrolases family 38 N-terminal domain/Alpha mannosidase middle domain/Glycosyl hydrolases family 38 C-terminal domain
MPRTVAVVAHTHWDREWYSPFEAYRSRLVGFMTQLLDLMESDGSFRCFLLDGQAALLDDYLAIRPGDELRISDLVGAGRLALGPWYVLMDEFCVSAETMVRNLQLGMARAERAGGCSGFGYLPDMFGHVAQMPQILAQAGLRHAVVWRGVPSGVGATGFWWEAPDGSRVRAEYLPVGYASGAFLPRDPRAFLRRVQAFEKEIGALLYPGAPLLLMNGGDHQPAQPFMPSLLGAANALQADYRFEQMSLAEYLDRAPEDGLEEWRGELRSGARANLLMGVLSNRVDIKIAAARAERGLERVAEPLAALWLPPDLWPEDRLQEAWLAVIRNSAHDSVCACSVDAVGRAVLARYDSAIALAEGVVEEALAISGVATVGRGPVVVNPSPRDRSGVVELVLPGSGSSGHHGAQTVAVSPSGVEERRGLGSDLGRLLGELAAAGWLNNGRPVDARLADDGGGLVLDLREDAVADADPATASTMAEAWARAGAGRDRRLTVRVERAASHRVVARVDDVPGFGWAEWSDSPLSCEPVVVDPAATVSNGLVTVGVDTAAGTLSINGGAGYDRLVDEGDDGDTYNYSPPAEDLRVDRPDEVRVEVLEAGPVRARIAVRRLFSWPARLHLGRRVGWERTEVDSVIEVRAGEGLVRVATTVDNRSRDHRLRAFFPLPHAAEAAVAECAFATVSRASAEGGPHEHPLPTFPSRRFVSAGGLTLTHEGLLAYEPA